MAPRAAPHRRLTPAALAAALAPACLGLERAAHPHRAALHAAWRDRLDVDAATLLRGWSQAATYAALLARHAAPQGWLAEAHSGLQTLGLAPLITPILDALPASAASAAHAPEFHLFEHLLAACDAATRESVGAYYTPLPLVEAQLALTHSVLTELGLAWTSHNLHILDPACGTGIYPRTLAAHTAAADLPQLARNLVACELLPGPAIAAHGHLTAAGLATPHMLCRDTLANPPLELPTNHILVCLGNPPYSRHTAHRSPDNLLTHFLPPAGAGIHTKNLYNDYVYFWHWALQAAFANVDTPGIVSFVTAASYLRGPGFARMRDHLRTTVDDLYIIDLGGDALGPRRSANIFNNVRIPVCIGLAVRRPGPHKRRADIHYTRLADTLGRADKLRALANVHTLADLPWTHLAAASSTFVPADRSDSSTWPRLTDLIPWQHSGAQFKRTWPIGETRELLERRWRALLSAPDRAAAFRESRDRTAAALADLDPQTPPPPITRYAWRSFDRQWCLADPRLGDFLRPSLWHTRSDRQIYLTSLLSTDTPSSGPTLVATADVPDLHHYSGRGGADILPLYRDPAAREPNLTPGLLPTIVNTLGIPITAEDIFSYIYACLAHPAYTSTLREPGPRVPLTRDPALFTDAATLGRALLRWHTFGARMNPDSLALHGQARCTTPVSSTDYPEDFEYDPTTTTLRVGDGTFAPVAPAVWTYAVSGLRIVSSWLGYRMQRPRGRVSSPLDALRPSTWTPTLTDELLEVLWVLEQSLALHVRQAQLLNEILAGPRLTADELPVPTDASRKPPAGAPRGALAGGALTDPS